MTADDASLIDLARGCLDQEWQDLARTPDAPPASPCIPPQIREAIGRSINSRTLTYRYVLPTQLLAKLAVPRLDCHSVQAGSGLPGAFDARSLCHKVIVPFDRQNHEVLGGSSEPYLNNPLRIPAITAQQRAAQKDKAGFDALCTVLDFAQDNPETVGELYRAVLVAIRERLADVHVVYPVPNRVSLEKAESIIASFLEERTGGLRLQSVAVALFGMVGAQFGLFATVRSAAVNAADASTGNVADLECRTDSDEVVLAVEVKDRQLVLRHIEDKLPGVREQGIRELLFLVQGGPSPDELPAIQDRIQGEFSAGQNVYISEFRDFLHACLILFGEDGRRRFLEDIGKELDTRRVDITHRRTWRDLLASV